MRIFHVVTVGFVSAGILLAPSADAQTGSERYIGEIIMGGWDFCPRGTSPANGDLFPISRNEALFSLLGTQYGGDGRRTFALPDLRGKTAVGEGQGPGLDDRKMGSKSSVTSVMQGNRTPIAVGTPNLAIKYCVVIDGRFPSRN